eukprot:Platyproteum_vivax@DN4088_c0_g2_i1.p1
MTATKPLVKVLWDQQEKICVYVNGGNSKYQLLKNFLESENFYFPEGYEIRGFDHYGGTIIALLSHKNCCDCLEVWTQTTSEICKGQKWCKISHPESCKPAVVIASLDISYCLMTDNTLWLVRETTDQMEQITVNLPIKIPVIKKVVPAFKNDCYILGTNGDLLHIVHTTNTTSLIEGNWLDVAAAPNHVIAVLQDGRIFTWGVDNTMQGYLGIGSQ